jgi:hypothetical protein
MSPDQRAEEVGQFAQDRKAAQQKLDGLLGTAKDLGEKLEQLGVLLQRAPEKIKFDGVGFDVKYVPLTSPSFKPQEIDGKAISELPTAIRNAMDEMKRLNHRARSLGYRPVTFLPHPSSPLPLVSPK